MSIEINLEADILRYYHVEKWRIGTIAKQLNVHHSVVKRVLAQAGIPKAKLVTRKSIIDKFLNFIQETLNKFPKLTASRLYAMVYQRGYVGGPDHFRHLIALHRPKPVAEAYLRLRTLPGEQSQVDWGHFGYINIGKAKRPLMAFVMTLSFSRKIFLQFYLNQQLANFLHGHEAAFNSWGGVPRVVLYDNLKSAVLERQGNAIRFNPNLLEFAAHYRYEPRPVAVARGNEKGRVERSIRYIRSNFFAAREWKDLADLNAQAREWCENQSSNRLCPEDKTLTVAEVFEQEKTSLLTLPTNPFLINQRLEVKVGKTPYVRFDLNDYSVPYNYVCKILTVEASLEMVFIFSGIEKIAEHMRSFDKGEQIENPAHIAELLDRKSAAKLHRGQDKLTHAVTSGANFLKAAAEYGYQLGSTTAGLLKLLELYGAAELEIGLQEAIKKCLPHQNTVRLILEQRRTEQNKLPPINIPLPDDSKAKHVVVQPHSLSNYDQLQTRE